ncbi:Hint domain-containing protein [Chryseolinea sp. T2]|uniref:Hint domain-containing protein n=1 Tax=Chryseolinea sp. T2 TaxID=3129255 RepID=UPI003078700F
MISSLRKYFALPLVALFFSIAVCAQDVPNPRPLKMEEYEKAKTFTIKNLDEDTYAKFENTYILDRYELRKPYFITGDDGLKKRIDLYNFIAKDGMQQLGILIFYTNEKNTLYKALLPNFTADAKVWEKYFEDIHAIDKIEKNFVLKLSYVLSKEMGYQVYKSLNQGKDLAKESATYGNDICFPGDQEVTLSDGSTKLLSMLNSGDKIMTADPSNNHIFTVTVDKVIEHEAKNYALTKLTLIRATEISAAYGVNVRLSARTLKATPNHPMRTDAGDKAMGLINTDEQVLCFDQQSGRYEYFTVVDKIEVVEGVQKVYSVEGKESSPVMMNGVMVLQK